MSPDMCPLLPEDHTLETKERRRFPTIDVEAVRKHMPPGFPPMDPNEMLSDVALAGVPLEPWGSAHFAASNRALWIRVAEMEDERDGLLRTLIVTKNRLRDYYARPCECCPHKP